MLLVRNKCDLTKKAVSTTDGRELAEFNTLNYLPSLKSKWMNCSSVWLGSFEHIKSKKSGKNQEAQSAVHYADSAIIVYIPWFCGYTLMVTTATSHETII